MPFCSMRVRFSSRLSLLIEFFLRYAEILAKCALTARVAAIVQRPESIPFAIVTFFTYRSGIWTQLCMLLDAA
jgi:hypothetical protein